MRLSEAMMLGRVTCKMVPGDWNSCGLGCAGNAVGIPLGVKDEGKDRFLALMDYWPWLTGKCPCGLFHQAGQHIWNAFDNEVCRGKMTFEQLADWVRSVEPSEDESPENGQAVVETKEVVYA